MTNDMIYQPPMNEGMPQGMAGGAPEGAGMDPQIVEGVQAFMQSQDPQIAVQVVMMLAEMLGLNQAPANPAQPPMQDPMGGAPMGRNGMRIPSYGKGGKVKTAFEKYLEFKRRKA